MKLQIVYVYRYLQRLSLHFWYNIFELGLSSWSLVLSRVGVKQYLKQEKLVKTKEKAFTFSGQPVTLKELASRSGPEGDAARAVKASLELQKSLQVSEVSM